MIRKIKVDEQEITLAASALTVIIYKNETGKDLLAQFSKFAKDNIEVAKKYKPEDIEKQSEEEKIQTASEINIDPMLILELGAAEIATAEYPHKRPFAEIISDIPASAFLFDSEFYKAVIETFTAFLPKKKD